MIFHRISSSKSDKDVIFKLCNNWSKREKEMGYMSLEDSSPS